MESTTNVNNNDENEHIVIKNKIDISDYEFINLISKGDSIEVKSCENKKTKEKYAMKIFKKIAFIHGKAYEHVQNEYKVLSEIYHPFICNLKGAYAGDPVNLYFLTELAEGGQIFPRQKKIFSLEETKFYIASLVTILDYLHTKKIVYRDIKPDNLFIDSEGYLKLYDFGNAKILKNDYTTTIIGQADYMAPEMINKTPYNFSVDYWSLGIIMYEMLVGRTPFNETVPLKIYQRIAHSRISFPYTIDASSKSLIRGLLRLDPKKRLGCKGGGAGEIVDHPFFENFDWKGLLLRKLKPNKKAYGALNQLIDLNDEEEDIPVEKEKDLFLLWE